MELRERLNQRVKVIKQGNMSFIVEIDGEIADEFTEQDVAERYAEWFCEQLDWAASLALEEARKIPELWVNSPSCQEHEDNPCCHKRMAMTISERIAALAESLKGSK